MTVVYYQGDRIYFRPLEVDDAPQLERWVNDPRVWSTLGRRLPINELREREWLEQYGKDEAHVRFGIVVRETDQMIGTAGLHNIDRDNRKAEFGIMIGDVDSHDQGYGSETAKLVLKFAFEELNLNRVYLGVFANNPRGIRAYEKAGYQYEGRDRKAYWRHGKYHDMLRYAVLRDEWAVLERIDEQLQEIETEEVVS